MIIKTMWLFKFACSVKVNYHLDDIHEAGLTSK